MHRKVKPSWSLVAPPRVSQEDLVMWGGKMRCLLQLFENHEASLRVA